MDKPPPVPAAVPFSRPLLGVLLLLWGIAPAPGWGGAVILDGTLGPAGPLPGPEFAVEAAHGSQVGSNLFHSFSQFDLSQGERATFSGPATTQHVISRVTGGSPSSIDGTIRSTLPTADLWFINPAGVVLGPNAALDVPGSFHASTADHLTLGDGGRFDAATPGNSVLTTAPPAAFGFLGPNPAPLTVNGSTLTPGGEGDLSLVGGAVTVEGATLTTGAGTLTLEGTAAGSPVPVAPPSPREAPPATAGPVTLTNSRLTTGAAGGTGAVVIRGGEVMISGGGIAVTHAGAGVGGGITLEAGGSLSLHGTEVVQETTGSGSGGPITLRAGGDATLEGFTAADAPTRVVNTTAEGSGGAGGAILLKAGNFSVLDGAILSAASNGSGAAGDVEGRINGTLSITGLDREGLGGVISSRSYASGPGGNVTLEAGRVVMRQGAVISTSTYADGPGGNLELTVGGELLLEWLDGEGYGSTVVSRAYDSGPGGNLTVRAGSATLRDGAVISTSTQGNGTAGDLNLVVEGLLSLEGVDSLGEGCYLVSQVYSGGDGGDLTVWAGSARLGDGALISTSTYDAGRAGDLNLVVGGELALTGLDGLGVGSSVVSRVFGGGAGGGVTVTAGSARLEDGARLSTTSEAAGNSGNLELSVTGSLILRGLDREGNGSGVVSRAFDSGAGGTLTLRAGEMGLYDGAVISTSSYADGDAGNIALHADGTCLLAGVDGWGEGSWIGSRAYAGGAGGRVVFTAQRATLGDGAVISTSSYDTSPAGTIAIRVAESLTLAGHDEVGSGTWISSSTYHTGAGGEISVEVPHLVLADGAVISSSAKGMGAAGNITLDLSGTLTLQGVEAEEGGLGSRILSESLEGGEGGAGGSIRIRAGGVRLTDGGGISATTHTAGTGGEIELRVAGTLELVGNDLLGNGSSIQSMSEGAGAAGELTVVAGALTMGDGGLISAGATSGGNGGTLRLTLGELAMAGGSQISAASSGTGRAGNLDLTVDGVATLRDSAISARTTLADGGNVILQVGRMLHLSGSAITTSVQGGVGDGGNITLDQPRFVVLNDGRIIANAYGGKGGNIRVGADYLLSRGDSLIQASSRLGLEGQVEVEAPVIDLGGTLDLTPSWFGEEQEMASRRCAGGDGRGGSSFLVSWGAGFAPSVELPLAASAMDPGGGSRVTGGPGGSSPLAPGCRPPRDGW